MRTGIVENANASVVAMHNEDRRLADLQRLEIALVGNFRDMRQGMPFRAIKNALELRFVNVAPVEYILGDGIELRRPMNLRFRHDALLPPCSRSLPKGSLLWGPPVKRQHTNPPYAVNKLARLLPP